VPILSTTTCSTAAHGPSTLAARDPARWPRADAWLAELVADFAARERGEGLAWSRPTCCTSPGRRPR
jgi:hypothetical protein